MKVAIPPLFFFWGGGVGGFRGSLKPWGKLCTMNSSQYVSSTQ